jgi:hypothetical protein
MALTLDSFAYTKKLVAINPSTFVCHPSRNGGYWSSSVEAIRFGKRTATKRRAVFYGSITLFGKTGQLSFQDFLDYTGKHNEHLPYIWDGQEFWGEENFWKTQEMVNLLDPILKTEPQLPLGWDGWFNLGNKR